jgi:hypothetical protein
MAEPTEESPGPNDTTGSETAAKESGDILSPVFRAAFGLPRGHDHDLRVINKLSGGSLVELHLGLNRAKNRKYALLRQHPDLERLMDIHPQRHALAHRERQIYIFEEAIRLNRQFQGAAAGIPASTDAPDSTRALEGTAQETVPTDVAPECASPSALPTPKRRHGPKPDMDSHLKVAAIATGLKNWKDELETLCNKLDQTGVPVSEFWRKRHLKSWVDALEETGPENIIKAVEYRLKKLSGKLSGNSR